jgi:hypothetical protein
MFVYILELLNEDCHQAFFNLSKGDRLATAAQKEKKRLAQKRNCTSRREHHKVAEEAVEGTPQWKCEVCGHKFTSCKSVKRHQCPQAKGVSRGATMTQGKGKTATVLKLNKLGPISSTAPSTHPPAPKATAIPGLAKKKRPRAPSSARDTTLATVPCEVLDEEFHSSTA